MDNKYLLLNLAPTIEIQHETEELYGRQSRAGPDSQYAGSRLDRFSYAKQKREKKDKATGLVTLWNVQTPAHRN